MDIHEAPQGVRRFFHVKVDQPLFFGVSQKIPEKARMEVRHDQK
jgi:hypothetical protein